MALVEVLLFLVIGALAGWLAGVLMRGHGYGLLANILIGILGALIGGLLFTSLGIDLGGFVGTLFIAFVGAAILLFVAGLFGRGTRH